MPLPNVIYAGNTLDDPKTAADYPATAGWSLKLRLAPRAGGSVINLNAVANGAGYRLQATAAATALWAPGWYTYELYVDNAGGEVYTLERGQLQILAALAGGQDTRTHAEKVLDAIQAVLEGRASADQEEVTIRDRSLKRTPIADLVALESRYRMMVQNERAALNLANGITGGGRRIQVTLR